MEKAKKNYLPLIIATSIGFVISFIIMALKGIFSEEDVLEIYKILSDSFMVPGVMLFGFGLLVFVANEGFFDIFVYGFYRFGTLFKKNVNKVKYKTFFDYKEAVKDHKKPISFLLISGLIVLVPSIVFMLFWIYA